MGKWILVGMVVAVVVITFSLIGLHVPQPKPAASGIAWSPYSTDALHRAAAAGKPVVIDFYADWCASCHVLERTVFADPAILASLSKMTALRVDATNTNSADVQAILDEYNVVGLPTVVFLDSAGREIKQARVEGAGAEEEFIRALNIARLHGA